MYTDQQINQLPRTFVLVFNKVKARKSFIFAKKFPCIKNKIALVWFCYHIYSSIKFSSMLCAVAKCHNQIYPLYLRSTPLLLSLQKRYEVVVVVEYFDKQTGALSKQFADWNHLLLHQNKFFHLFVAFFPFMTEKDKQNKDEKICFNAEKKYFDQQMACGAPISWLKHTIC